MVFLGDGAAGATQNEGAIFSATKDAGDGDLRKGQKVNPCEMGRAKGEREKGRVEDWWRLLTLIAVTQKRTFCYKSLVRDRQDQPCVTFDVLNLLSAQCTDQLWRFRQTPLFTVIVHIYSMRGCPSW